MPSITKRHNSQIDYLHNHQLQPYCSDFYRFHFNHSIHYACNLMLFDLPFCYEFHSKTFSFTVGVEICYELYNPRVRKIEVLKLEKRLDDTLMYLRDALPEYSSFNFDMQPVHFEITGDVPVNPVSCSSKTFLICSILYWYIWHLLCLASKLKGFMSVSLFLL